MTQINAGRVRFVPRGGYSNSTQYYLFDLVNYNGNSYYAKENTLGNLPTDTSKWQLIAEKGDIGPIGPTGETGNGIASIVKTSTSGYVDTYTITFTDGTTTTFEVTNGEDGEVTQEQFDKLVEENTYLNSIINQMPKVSSQGTILTLNNTINGRMNIELGTSELEQETTTGKNKLAYSLQEIKSTNTSGTWSDNVYTYNGVKFTINDDLSVTIGGTYNDRAYLYLQGANRQTIEKTSYVLSGTPADGSTTTYMMVMGVNDGSTSTGNVLDVGASNTLDTTSYTSTPTIRTYIDIRSSAGIGKTFYPMLRLSSVTDDTYEQFTGGIPAPNPQFPMSIHTISGNNKVVVCGKNLLNIQTIVKGRIDDGEIGYASDTYNLVLNNDSFSFSTYANYRGTVTDYRIAEENTKYVYKTDTIRTGISNALYCYDKNKNYLGPSSANYIDNYTIEYTTLANTNYVRLSFLLNATGSITIDKPRLSKNVATDFTPYVSQEANINLGNIEYCEIGDYKDKFVRSDGSNLFDKDNVNVLNAYIDSTNGNIGNDNNARTIYIPCKANTSYTISKIVSPRFIVGLTSTLPANGVTCLSVKRDDSATHLTLEGNANAKYIVVYLTNSYNSSTWNDIINSLMINEGSTALPYESYGIGNWGIRKNIGKVVLDGTQTTNSRETSDANKKRFYVRLTDNLPNQTINCICDKLVSGTLEDGYFYRNSITTIISNTTYYGNICFYREDFASYTAEQVKTALAQNNMIVYYILDTPTYTPITGTLAEQLENIYQYLLSYKGQTSISQINNDLPFEISASALLDLNSLVGE